MNQTIYEKGLQEGLVEGLIGQIRLCEGVLDRTPKSEVELAAMPVDELKALAEVLRAEVLNRQSDGAGH